MADVARKSCIDPFCSKLPSYGIEGSKKPEFCNQHAKEGMVDVRHKKCADPRCSKRPSYGMEGSTNPEFCVQHAIHGMVDIANKKCAEPCCSKLPSYGIEGTNIREYCVRHAKEGMVDIHNRKCADPCCSKRPSYGIEGSTKPRFCKQHAEKGMINIRNKKCVDARRSKQASYGVEGSSKPESCSQHGMVGVRNRNTASQGCTKSPVSGFEGSGGRELLVRDTEESFVRLYSGRPGGGSRGTEECGRVSPSVDSTGSNGDAPGIKREELVESSTLKTKSSGIDMRRASRKRARRRDSPMTSDSVQAGPHDDT